MIIGIDVGGTHIDGVMIHDKKILKKGKVAREDQLFSTIWTLLKELIKDIDTSQISKINLSTTVSTNAIVEDTLSKVALFIQAGAGRNYDFLNPAEENIRLSGYMDHRGTLVKGFEDREILSQIEHLKNQGIQNCGMVGKFSTRNPSEELRGKDLLKESFSHVSMGHRMSGNLNFARRVYTTYLNEGVYDIWNTFMLDLKKSLDKEGIHAPIYILKADGGTMKLEEASEKPVETILSGPAASYMGMTAMFSLEKDAVLLDIGGTTTDLFFLADGQPLFKPLGIEIQNYQTLVRSIYSVSIGLGGDSCLTIKDKEIKIGPHRQGLAVGLGGSKATPTDAMIALGLLDIGNQTLSKQAMESFGKALGLSMKETAQNILNKMVDIIHKKITDTLKEINTKPVYTIKELLYGKEIKPEEIKVIGGPAKVFAPLLEHELSIPCAYPENYELANAIGASLAKTTKEISLLVDTEKRILNIAQLGIYEKIDKRYHLERAEKKAIAVLRDLYDEDSEIEIIESNSFNMVDGFSTKGQNIRIKAQIKPGLIYRLEELGDV